MRLITLTVLLLCMSFVSLCQTKEETLSDITNKYLLIKELVSTNALRQYHTDHPCIDPIEKGNLTFYYNSSELKHIVHTYVLNHVKFRDEFYIWDDQLFFQKATHKVRFQNFKKDSLGKEKLAYITVLFDEQLCFEKGHLISHKRNCYESTNTPYIIRPRYSNNIGLKKGEEQKALEKFNALLELQRLKVKGPTELPKSITKKEPQDIIYNTIGSF